LGGAEKRQLPAAGLVPAAIQAFDSRGQQRSGPPERFRRVRIGWYRSSAYTTPSQQARPNVRQQQQQQQQPDISDPSTGPIPENDRLRLLRCSGQVGSGCRIAAPEQLQHGTDHQTRIAAGDVSQGRVADGLASGRRPEVCRGGRP